MSLRDQMQEILYQYPFRHKQHTNKHCNNLKDNNSHKTGCLKVKSSLEKFLNNNIYHNAYNDQSLDIINAGYTKTGNEINNGYQTITQPTPLQYFICSMQTTSSKRKESEIEDIWYCIKLLLQNGALPPSYFKITSTSLTSYSSQDADNIKIVYDQQTQSYSLRMLHEFRKCIMEHIKNEDIIYDRLQYFMSMINRNYKLSQTEVNEDINQSIITYNLYSNNIWIMSDLYPEQNIDDGIPEPKLFQFYLKQQFDILHLFEDDEMLQNYDYIKMSMHRIAYNDKQRIIKEIIKTQLKNKRGFAKYLLPFRECARLFRMERVKEFEDILCEFVLIDDGNIIFGTDLIDLLLSYIYDDMNYLRYDTIEKDRKFVNDSLNMYSYLSIKWKQWIFDNYILKIPKDELAKLDSFAYLCYL